MREFVSTSDVNLYQWLGRLLTLSRFQILPNIILDVFIAFILKYRCRNYIFFFWLKSFTWHSK